MTAHPLEPSVAELDALTAACVAFVREHLRTLAEQPAADAEAAEALRPDFREPVPESGRPIDQVLARLGPAIARSFNTAGPGYFAFIPGGGIPTAALADYVGLSTNRYVGVNKAAPALAEIEATTVRWMASIVGYGAGAGGILTSGGSMSNLLAIVAARAAKLPEAFFSGVLYTSRETHLSVSKSARVAGFPASHVRALPVDDRLRLDVRSLREAIEADAKAGRTPFLIVANAGTTNTGAIDPLPEILRVAREHGLWVHADAAYGGFFNLVPEARERLAGLDECDSVTLDPHKGLFLPYGTGCLVLRDPNALHRAHAGEAEYLRDVASDDETINFTDLSPELSRDFRGLRLWLPLQLHGLGAFRAQLAEKLSLTRVAYEALRNEPRLEIVDEPQLSIVAFRMKRGGDAATRALLERVNAGRRVFLSSTVLGGKLTGRLCILSFRSHADRVGEAVEAIQRGAAGIDP
ncbi:MAG TPA: aminotransferase class V-fold PLP-dependent enzyme [Polyangiaceae bacterium]|jgi:aromatic-L-amino-acid decarboxylase